MESEARVGLPRLLFGAIFVLALGLRLSSLGAFPLNDAESGEALWAAEGTPEDSVFWPREADNAASSAVYQTATWMAFQAFGGGAAVARVFPALVGAFVVVPPWLLRRRLGLLSALITSFLLAVSPTMLATSRAADGASAAMVAVTLGGAALLLALDEQWSPKKANAIFAASLAVGLAAGPAFFVGLVGLAPAILLARRLAAGAWSGAAWDRLRPLLPRAIGIGVLGAVVLAVAAGFLPRGMTALAEGLRVWLLGWIGPGEMHALSPVVILLIYEPLILIFGVIGAVAAGRTRAPLNLGAGLWVACALLVAILYPARSGAVVAWVVLPLAALAGQSLAREAERFRALAAPWQAAGVAGLVLLLFLYVGVQLSAYASGIGPGLSPLVPQARLAVAGGALIVTTLALVLIGLGWSWDIARSGAAAAGAVLLLWVTLSSGWRLNYVRLRLGASELWSSSAPAYGVPRLAATIDSLSVAVRGVRDDIPLAIESAHPPPSLLWVVRAHPRFATSDSGVAESPPIVLEPWTELAPQLPADYLGQTVVLRETNGFTGLLPPDFLRWWWRREVPAVEDRWLLLVRSDVATLGESEVDLSAP
jgi:hypothetical protein